MLYFKRISTMNSISIFILKLLKRGYAWVSPMPPMLTSPIICENDPDKVSKIIYDKLMEDKPCMIARFGSTELSCLVNYLGVKGNSKSWKKFILGQTSEWWWSQNIIDQMQKWSGFFPPTEKKITQFCELMLNDMQELDVLGSWLPDEKLLPIKNHPVCVARGRIDPFWASNPWTQALKGKRVLVVHPFEFSITQQYKKRRFLFENQNILPDFDLYTLKAIQTLGQNNTTYRDWFDALDYMKNEIDKIDYDICLIGAGAYGFPLAAHVKRKGKKAVHIGGSLQLFFGIKGKRWEEEAPVAGTNYPQLINEYWVRPTMNECPQNKDAVEGGCYW